MTLASVVLAAGEGTRLRPLTLLRPKPLCPVNNIALIDLALARAAAVTPDVAVNISVGREMMEQHLDGRAYLSIEEPAPIGTAGALVRLREWLAGRDVLVVNADAWYPGTLDSMIEDWDGETIRLLATQDARRADFGTLRYAGSALIPARYIADLATDAFGLYEAMWKEAFAQKRIQFVTAEAPFVDCGTPADYHAANMAASDGENVVGSGAVVDGEVFRSVLWPRVKVGHGERLENAIRASADLTVVVSVS